MNKWLKKTVNAKESAKPYQSKPLYRDMLWDRDVMVPMRDGVRICVDIYRPKASGKFPAILAIAFHNKDLQTTEIADAMPPQPAWSTFWHGVMEGGDTRHLVSRGYVHIIGNPRGVGKSEEGDSMDSDYYDLIEWVAVQPWCDGNIGMIGISAYASSQWRAAPKGTAGLSAIEYIPYHVCSSKTVEHNIYHNERYPSHLLLTVIP